MKRSDLVFASLLVPLDLSMLMAAGLAAYFLRFQTLTHLRPALFEIPFQQYIGYTIGVSLFFIFVFAASGLYRIGFHRIRNEIQRLFTACSTGIMAVIVFIFFVQELFSSRFIILAAWLLSFVFVLFGRSLARAIRLLLFSKGVGTHGLALIGSPSRINFFKQEIERKPHLGYTVSHATSLFNDEIKAQWRELINGKRLDEIIVLDGKMSQDDFSAVLDFADLNHVGVRYSADRIGSKNLDIRTMLGIPMVEIKRTRLEGWGRILKRFFDLLASSLLILISAPFLFLIAVAIRLESKGSPVYANERVGENGRLFSTLKFRSMYLEYCTGKKYDPSGLALEYELELAKTKSERKGPIFKVLNDPRRTKVGKLLERFSFDELPQLFNVFLGNMSLVGPRPHMPVQVANYEKQHHQLFAIKPGITGMAQIEGRSDLDFDDEARLDIFYIENWSLMLDLIILLKTPWVVLTRKSRV